MAAGTAVNRFGERLLIIGGLTLQATGFAWIAVIASPNLNYLEMIPPLVVAGCGTALAMPAAQNAVLGSVPREAIGVASGSFNSLRQLGGAFGIAIIGAVFADAGNYTSPQAFTNGFTAAMVVAAILSFAAATMGIWAPSYRSHETSAPVSEEPGRVFLS
jgi:MFS family permease